MFKQLTTRMSSSMGMKKYSLESLEDIDIDSVDSICISNGDTNSTNSSNGLSDIHSVENIQEYAKRKVIKLLRSIKKLQHTQSEYKDHNMSMAAFMDMLQNQKYSHVSMCMFKQFIRECRMVPKPHYLHYYKFFLYYGMYYHHIRANVDVIEENMIPHHQKYLTYMKAQVKYLHTIIRESRLKDIDL